eukprot:7246763-Pyramimonas_sp.AAC.1
MGSDKSTRTELLHPGPVGRARGSAGGRTRPVVALRCGEQMVCAQLGKVEPPARPSLRPPSNRAPLASATTPTAPGARPSSTPRF